LISSFVIVRI